MRPMRLQCWLLIALLAFAARPADAEVSVLLRGYSLTSWVEGDGRPLGSVYAMVQDRDGYLWIGSDAGLFRFDGSSFTPWNTLSRSPLPPVAVRALSVTSRGTLLVGLADGTGGREVRDGGLMDLTHTGLPKDDMTEIVEDHDGVIWAVAGRVLYVLRDRTWQKVELPWAVRPGLVLQPYVSRNGDLWISTRWGVFRRAAGTDAFERVSDEYVWGLSEDAGGTIWTTDIVAGYRRLASRKAPRHELEGAGYRLTHDRRGNLWVATFGKGLWRVRTSQTSGPPAVEIANLRTGLSSDSVQSVFEDRDGNVWVGTTGGLHRLKVRALTPVEDVGFVVAAEPAENGHVWAGTTNGVIQFAGSPGLWTRVGDDAGGPDVRSLHRDEAGTLWVGASEGLWQLTHGRLTQIASPALRRMVVMSIVPDGRSGLWLGDGEWLFQWDGTQVQPFRLPTPSRDLQRITFARGDSSGRVWLGFGGGRIGLLEHDRTLRLIDVSSDTTDLHTVIHTMLEDRRGTLWFGGSAGLSRFENGRIQTLSRASGLTVDVRAIVEDLQGRLWLSVDRGLIRVERDELMRALADRSYRLRYRLYDPHDGLAGAPVGIIGSTRSSDGALWFVRGGGVTTVDPQDLETGADHAPPGPRIESVVANDQPSRPDPSVSFPAGTTRIEIRYTALTLSVSDRIRFRYRLDGVDTAWTDAGTRRTVSYTNLAPGNYRFQVDVDAGGEDDVSGIEPATWSFSIQPAFHQTRGFLVMALAAALLSIWGIWHGRLSLIRRRFSLALAERARLSREIHDTLLQSLVGVTLQFDAIANTLGPSSTTAKEQLIRIRREVEAYIRDARQSISDLRSPLLEAGDLMTVLKAFGKRTIGGDNAVRFITSVTGTPRQYSPKVDNQLLRIGQEAIVNAVRHAHASRILLEVRFEKLAVTLRVSDDGRGFESASSEVESDQHYGLTTMRERAQELGGQLTVVSTPGAGTVVEAIVPTSGGAHWIARQG